MHMGTPEVIQPPSPRRTTTTVDESIMNHREPTGAPEGQERERQARRERLLRDPRLASAAEQIRREGGDRFHSRDEFGRAIDDDLPSRGGAIIAWLLGSAILLAGMLGLVLAALTGFRDPWPGLPMAIGLILAGAACIYWGITIQRAVEFHRRRALGFDGSPGEQDGMGSPPH